MSLDSGLSAPRAKMRGVMRSLHVLPTTDGADDFLARLAGSAPLSAVLGQQVVTLGRLEDEIATGALLGQRKLDDVTRMLAIECVLRSGEWTPYEAVVMRRGFKQAVSQFLAECAQGGVSFDALDAVAQKLPESFGTRTRALASIGRAYLALLDGRGLIDPLFALSLACDRLQQGQALPELFDEIGVVHFHDILDWRPGRLRLLGALARALAARGGRVVVSMPSSNDAALSEVLEPAISAIEGLDASVEVVHVALRVEARVQAVSTADDAAERRTLAARVVALLAEGVSPGDICVAARGMQERAVEVRRALLDVGVPVRDRRGRRLAESSVVRVALGFCRLDSPASTTRARISALVASSLIDLRGLFADAPRPATLARHLEEAAIRSRVTDGDGGDGFDTRLERLARARTAEGNERDANDVERSRKALQALFERLDAWPREATRARHARALLSLLEALRLPARLRRLDFGLPRALTHRPDPGEVAQATALAFEQSAWTALTSALTALTRGAQALGVARQTVSRQAFTQALAEVCESVSLRTGQTRGAAVELVEPGDLAGRRVLHVLFMGADADALPGPGDTQTLLADDERRLINRALGHAAFRTTPVAGEASVLPSRQLLRAADAVLAFAAARDGLTLLYARNDPRQRPRAPSPLWGVVGSPAPDSLPFSPLDPRRAGRDSKSIAVRRSAVVARADFFTNRTPSEWAGTLDPRAIAVPTPGRPDRPLSAGELEVFAACAFRWLGERLWRIDEHAQAEQSTSPLESGRLAHGAVESAVRAIVEAGAWRNSRKDEAVSIGLLAATQRLDELEPQTVVGHPQLRVVERERFLRRLAHLIPQEIEATCAVGLTPRHFELGFGVRDASFHAIEVAGVHLSGRIDRVDVGDAGAMVIDYKSGSVPGIAQKLSPKRFLTLEFQLPLYIAAMKALFPDLAARSVDATYVSLRGGGRTKTVLESLSDPLDEAIRKLGETAHDVVDSIAGGRFAPAPLSCEYCSLRPVCRIPRPVKPS